MHLLILNSRTNAKTKWNLLPKNKCKCIHPFSIQTLSLYKVSKHSRIKSSTEQPKLNFTDELKDNKATVRFKIFQTAWYSYLCFDNYPFNTGKLETLGKQTATYGFHTKGHLRQFLKSVTHKVHSVSFPAPEEQTGICNTPRWQLATGVCTHLQRGTACHRPFLEIAHRLCACCPHANSCPLGMTRNLEQLPSAQITMTAFGSVLKV